jgi:predicted nuclease of predicted toxin-antitoxin system
MRIYLDDNITDGRLVTQLKKAGHGVVLPLDVGTNGVTDPSHLIFAIRQELILLTRNHDDFEDLHNLVMAAGGNHFGVFTVRADNDPSRDMKIKIITSAIGKVERSGIQLANQLIVLNHWR